MQDLTMRISWECF
jgi:hypothetical protein